MITCNDGPVLDHEGAMPLVWTDGDGAAKLTARAELRDADDAELQGAKMGFADGYVRGEDRLAFEVANGITGTFDEPTGKLVLTGAAAVAHHQTALRSVTYVFVRPVNDAPRFSDAVFVDPQDGAEITVTGDDERPFTVEWNAATDAEGDTVRYAVEMSLVDIFSDVVFTADVGRRARYEPEIDELIHLLDTLDVAPGASTELFYRVVASDGEAETHSSVDRVTLVRATSVGAEDEPGLPKAVTLAAACPNPFYSRATIRYGLDQATAVRVVVYDLLGRPVRILADGRQAAGWYDVHLQADGLASGLYVYRLETDERMLTGRVVLVE